MYLDLNTQVHDIVFLDASRLQCLNKTVPIKLILNVHFILSK